MNNLLPILKHNDRVSVSDMTGKLKGIPAINTNPLNNPFCVVRSKQKNSICGKCYSVTTMKRYGSADRRFQNNGRLLSTTTINPHTVAIWGEIIRLSAHGELINYKHMTNLMAIVKIHPLKIFTLWTKRKNLISRFLKANTKPKNVIFVYSAAKLNKTECLPLGFDKVFTVYTKTYLSAVSADKTMIDINCGSYKNIKEKKCIDCMKCYRKADRTIYISMRQ